MKIEIVRIKDKGIPVEFWVKVNDSYMTSLTKKFLTEEEATKYFEELVVIAESDNEEESQIVLKSYSK